MTKKILQIISKFSFSHSLMRVNNLFFKTRSENDLIRLDNNFVFQHACMTPLTILSCSLDVIEKNNSKKEKEDALISAKYACSRITELVCATTKQAGTRDNFNLSETLLEVVTLFKRKNNCMVEYSNLVGKSFKLKGNKLYFQEMIVCLLNNAFEAYSSSQTVYISFIVRRVGKKILIHIVDYASGMTLLAQKIALIEGISYKEKGLGLGLFFTKRTIENQFNGEMNIVSRLGIGTHVQITIPTQ